MAIRAVLFDRTTSMRGCIEAQYDAFDAELAHVTKAHYLARFLTLDQRGYVSKAVVYPQLGLEFGLSPALTDRLYVDYGERYHQNCVGFRHLAATLTQLTTWGLRLGIVTNGWAKIQHATIAALDLEHYFTAVLISETEGMKKPAPDLFLRAVARVAATPASTLFVGDHPHTDIAGAKEVGIRGVWMRDPYFGDCPAATWVIDELPEILAIVAQEERRTDLPT